MNELWAEGEWVLVFPIRSISLYLRISHYLSVKTYMFFTVLMVILKGLVLSSIFFAPMVSSKSHS